MSSLAHQIKEQGSSGHGCGGGDGRRETQTTAQNGKVKSGFLYLSLNLEMEVSKTHSMQEASNVTQSEDFTASTDQTDPTVWKPLT